MATVIDSGLSQQPLVENTTNIDLINCTTNIIRELTGYPPANADHVYDLMQHIDEFPHPCPTVTDNTGGTLPTRSPCQPIAENLQGWEDVSSQEVNSVHAVFHHVEERDQRLAYDHFFRTLGRAPRVLEFSRFLLIFEGNDLTDSSRKTLGQLYLENGEIRETLNRHLRTMDLLQQMLSSNDSMIQTLGQSNDQNVREVNNLQSQKRNLESVIRRIQHQKADLQLDYNALKMDHDQHLAELEDERKDKQELQADKQVFKHRCERLQADKQALQVQLQNQRQQYFILFFAALIFGMVFF